MTDEGILEAAREYVEPYTSEFETYYPFTKEELIEFMRHAEAKIITSERERILKIRVSFVDRHWLDYSAGWKRALQCYRTLIRGEVGNED